MLRVVFVAAFLAMAAPVLALDQPRPSVPQVDNPRVDLPQTDVPDLAPAPQPFSEQASDQRPAPKPQPGRTPPAPTAPPATPEAAPRPAPASPTIPASRVNVQIELTITDQAGNGAPEKKTVTLLAADRTFGRVRASAEASGPNMGRVGTTLNVDARPSVLPDGGIFLELTIEYRPLIGNTDAARTPTNLNESLSVMLTSGKSLVLSQAADPISDRKMTVEAKATVLK